jgi:hypothetical protein
VYTHLTASIRRHIAFQLILGATGVALPVLHLLVRWSYGTYDFNAGEWEDEGHYHAIIFARPVCDDLGRFCMCVPFCRG